jgi:hypothetical protein
MVLDDEGGERTIQGERSVVRLEPDVFFGLNVKYYAQMARRKREASFNASVVLGLWYSTGKCGEVVAFFVSVVCMFCMRTECVLYMVIWPCSLI